jgi:hypothetical protein
MARKIWVAAAVALAPALAGAADKKVEKQPPEAAGDITGSLGFMLGFGDNFHTEGKFKGVKLDGDADGSPTLAIIPSVEKRLGNVVAIGGEYMFVWAKTEKADDRTFLMSPHVRVRMSFPVYDRTTFDGVFGLGPTIWTAPDKATPPFDSTRFGWSLRFAFGGSYAFNDSVSAFADLGYYRSTTYGDDVTAVLTSIPFTVGLRSSF